MARCSAHICGFHLVYCQTEFHAHNSLPWYNQSFLLMPPILPLRAPRSVLLTLCYAKLEPLRGAKTDQQPRGFAGLKKTKKFCRVGGGVGSRGGIMRARKPPHHQKTKLKKFGVWGRNRDQLILFISFLRSTAGSSMMIGCRLDPRNEKTRHWRVLRKQRWWNTSASW